MSVIDLPIAGRSTSRTPSRVREPTAEQLTFRRTAFVMECWSHAMQTPAEKLAREADEIEQSVKDGLVAAVRDHQDSIMALAGYYGLRAIRARIFRAVLKERGRPLVIVTDSCDTSQMHFWVRCTRDQRLEDGRQALKGHRYFVLWPWDSSNCGPCTDPDHPNCDAGAFELAGLENNQTEMFCAADFEPVNEAEAAELMASMIRGPERDRAELDWCGTLPSRGKRP